MSIMMNYSDPAIGVQRESLCQMRKAEILKSIPTRYHSMVVCSSRVQKFPSTTDNAMVYWVRMGLERYSLMFPLYLTILHIPSVYVPSVHRRA